MKVDEPALGEIVNRAARLLRRLADVRLGRFGLSSGYLPIVTALMKDDGLTQKALVSRAGIEQPTMVKTLARMERDGIIERRSDPADKRIARFSLTASTRAQLPDIRSAIRALSDEAVAELTVEQRASIGDALLSMSTTIEAALREA